MTLSQPLPIVIENGPEKMSGFVMKLTLLGLLIEIDKISFSVGSFLNATIQLNEKTQIVQRLRSIKHYDKYYRKPPPKAVKEGEPLPVPKMLFEAHFHLLSEPNRVAISKFLLQQQQRTR